MTYNTTINRIECEFCRVEMKAFGGRFTPRFSSMPEMWLCVKCGHALDLNEALNEAIIVAGAMRRRRRHNRRYIESVNGHRPHDNGRPEATGSVRRKLVELLLAMLVDEQSETRYNTI